ncbi:THUMP domain-containing protein, partial [Aerococcus sp. UMB9870]
MFLHLEDAPQDKILERLQDVFGIQSYSPALTIERDFEKLKEVAVEVVAKEMAKSDIKTFKIATSRSDHSYRLDTNAINRELGA